MIYDGVAWFEMGWMARLHLWSLVSLLHYGRAYLVMNIVKIARLTAWIGETDTLRIPFCLFPGLTSGAVQG
jgi:hypothetical protein